MKVKKMLAVLVTLCMAFILVTPISASAQENDKTIKIEYGVDYENKETGEYFRWKDVPSEFSLMGSVAKSFEFNIRYSVESTSFKIDSSSVKVKASAHVENYNGTRVSGYSGHKYTVELFKGFTTKSVQMKLGKTESGTISGLSKGSNYKLRVVNNDRLGDNHYLVGSGTITNN
ncbi:hypothetical protein J2Z32_002293 [Paenibacillus turicensis]|uniref:DUF5626 domain-containing protein n=1 Tax=Paenibacillus turicensis TaxID=160487 RepID=A0ABS4FSU6_9BACL|nr:hypothetical protein [Paenibacillus turicensis]MBP1905663.1 hypothetical protein [Paenibacillus turicensis]